MKSDILGVGVLEVQIVLALLVELGRSDVKGNLDLAFVSSVGDGSNEEVEGLFSARDVGCETSLITDIGGCIDGQIPRNC